VIDDCWAAAADGSAATASDSPATTAFFMIVPLKGRSTPSTITLPPWLFAERRPDD
jgi:hypothetical protein